MTGAIPRVGTRPRPVPPLRETPSRDWFFAERRDCPGHCFRPCLYPLESSNSGERNIVRSRGARGSTPRRACAPLGVGGGVLLEGVYTRSLIPLHRQKMDFIQGGSSCRSFGLGIARTRTRTSWRGSMRRLVGSRLVRWCWLGLVAAASFVVARRMVAGTVSMLCISRGRRLSFCVLVRRGWIRRSWRLAIADVTARIRRGRSGRRGSDEANGRLGGLVAANDAREPGACTDDPCETQSDEVRLNACAASVATGRGHRCVLAVLRSSLRDLAGRERLHGESVRLAGLLPGFAELVSVKEPEDAADENQNRFVDGAGDRQSTERGSPSERPRDAAVPHDDRHGPNRLTDERTDASHNASTVSRVSRDVEGAGWERRDRRCGAPPAGRQRLIPLDSQSSSASRRAASGEVLLSRDPFADPPFLLWLCAGAFIVGKRDTERHESACWSPRDVPEQRIAFCRGEFRCGVVDSDATRDPFSDLGRLRASFRDQRADQEAAVDVGYGDAVQTHCVHRSGHPCRSWISADKLFNNVSHRNDGRHSLRAGHPGFQIVGRCGRGNGDFVVSVPPAPSS